MCVCSKEAASRGRPPPPAPARSGSRMYRSGSWGLPAACCDLPARTGTHGHTGEQGVHRVSGLHIIQGKHGIHRVSGSHGHTGDARSTSGQRVTPAHADIRSRVGARGAQVQRVTPAYAPVAVRGHKGRRLHRLTFQTRIPFMHPPPPNQSPNTSRARPGRPSARARPSRTGWSAGSPCAGSAGSKVGEVTLPLEADRRHSVNASGR